MRCPYLVELTGLGRLRNLVEVRPDAEVPAPRWR